LTVPAGFSLRVQGGTAPPLLFDTDSNSLSRSYDEFRVQRAVYTLLADVLTLQGESASTRIAELDRLNAAPRRLQLRERPAGELQEIPSGFEQAVPGMMVMFTMIVLFTSGAATLFQERQAGMLRRLAAAPLNPLQIVLGKLCGRLALALIQVLFAMLAGTLLFGVDCGPDLPMVLAVLFAWALLCAAFATLLGSVARSESQVISLGLSAAIIMGALGGCMWPVEISPDWMQLLQKGLPAGWAMDALHQLVNFQNGAAAGAWQLALLLVAAAVLTLLAVRRFRYTD
jgi:ABC-type multidrug transport system permease subunit